MESAIITHMEHHILNSHAKKARFVKASARRAFSLLELLIVVAIIGILVSVGVVSYSTAQKKSRDSRRTADMKAVQAAFEQYYADNNGSYPSSCAAVDVTYLPAGIPVDPKTGTSYTVGATCSLTSYCFCALLESGSGNAGAACNYSASPKTYFCVSSLQ